MFYWWLKHWTIDWTWAACSGRMRVFVVKTPNERLRVGRMRESRHERVTTWHRKQATWSDMKQHDATNQWETELIISSGDNVCAPSRGCKHWWEEGGANVRELRAVIFFTVTLDRRIWVVGEREEGILYSFLPILLPSSSFAATTSDAPWEVVWCCYDWIENWIEFLKVIWYTCMWDLIWFDYRVRWRSR